MNTLLTDNFYYFLTHFILFLYIGSSKEFLKVGFFDFFWKKMECLKMISPFILAWY